MVMVVGDVFVSLFLLTGLISKSFGQGPPEGAPGGRSRTARGGRHPGGVPLPQARWSWLPTTGSPYDGGDGRLLTWFQ